MAQVKGESAASSPERDAAHKPNNTIAVGILICIKHAVIALDACRVCDAVATAIDMALRQRAKLLQTLHPALQETGGRSTTEEPRPSLTDRTLQIGALIHVKNANAQRTKLSNGGSGFAV